MAEANVKMLAIVPSKTIGNLLKEATASKEQLEIDIYIGNLYSALEIIREKLTPDYDVILSRGETAAMIRKATSIPVIEIPLSFYDILHAIKLADTLHEPYAVVGFSPVTNSAHLLRDLLHLPLEIHTVLALEDAITLMDQLKKKGIRLIVSGMGIDHIVKQHGFNSILINTSTDSMLSAVNQALQVGRSFSKQKTKAAFLKLLLEKGTQDLAVFNTKYELVFSSFRQVEKSLALSIAEKELENIWKTTATIHKNRGGILISAEKVPLRFQGEDFLAFYFSQKTIPYAASKNEIKSYSRTEVIDTFLLHFYELSANCYDSALSLEQIIHSPYPVILLGENGVGKVQIAATIYSQGRLKTRPFVVIDLHFITDKIWSFITTNANSPLNDTKTTIFIKGLEHLLPSKVEKLKNFLFDSGTCKRNRIILSYALAPGEHVPPHILSITNYLACNVLRIPPLRERINEILPLSGLYINTLNVDLNKKIIGFSEEASLLVKEYQWPGNLIQFKRVITQLVTITSSSFIQAESVKKVLEIENQNLTSTSQLSSVLNLDKTLDEIERDVVRTVLAENRGNQSQTAIKLGISRSTLWRIINK